MSDVEQNDTQETSANVDRLRSSLGAAVGMTSMSEAPDNVESDSNGPMKITVDTVDTVDGDDEKTHRQSSTIRGVVRRDRHASADEQQIAIGKLVAAFEVFDSDHGGFIESDELSNICKLVDVPFDEETLRLMMLEMKADEAGRIHRQQFLDAFTDMVSGGVEDSYLQSIYNCIQADEVAKLRRAFEACDTDGSGEIDEAELKLVMTSLGENISEKGLKKMFRELDTSGDGEVDFDEFIRFMCNRRQKVGKKGKFFNVDAINTISSFLAEKDISEAESNAEMAKMPVLEKIGANYMKDAYRRKEIVKKKQITKAANEVHILNQEELKALQRVEWWAVFLDGFFGVVSGVLAGLAELYAQKEWATDGFNESEDYNADPWDPSLTTRIVYYWALVGGISVGATVIEIVLIYYVHLRASVNVSRITGLRLFPVDKERAYLTAALARAALELPHPQGEEFGVNPLQEASKIRLFIAAIVYKSKTGLTTFVLRLLFKRVITRSAAKGAGAFLAVPVNAVWNMLIGYKTLRAVRVISLGPSVAIEVFNQLTSNFGEPLPVIVKEGVMRAIACCVVGLEQMHPNLHWLLRHAQDRLDYHLSSSTEDDIRNEAEEAHSKRKSDTTDTQDDSRIFNDDETGATESGTDAVADARSADVEMGQLSARGPRSGDDLTDSNETAEADQDDEKNDHLAIDIDSDSKQTARVVPDAEKPEVTTAFAK
jgi:Ca2+-binding EF-hand superfamily protein